MVAPLEAPLDGVISVAAHRRLLDYTVGPNDIALPFTQRLAQENAWSLAYAARVVEEYKRFCYLCIHSKRACTPSLDVDQAWHLHLTYSRDYWGEFCPNLLGQPLHHGPTDGGAEEDAKFLEQYNETLQYYEQVFQVPPPSDVWPEANIRFSQHLRLRWVDLSKVYAVQRKKVHKVLPILLLGTALLTVAITSLLF